MERLNQNLILYNNNCKKIQKMIPLKQHNDIVQKLMKELSNKQSQMKNILKQKVKVPSQIPQLEANSNEKMLNGRINQLNKEYKQKINSLNQQLRNKSVENKDLKERLTMKANIEAKEKDHIAEVMKKNYDRKPSSAQDYKISALISHYEAEIAKKSKFIECLQKQIKQYELSSTLQTTIRAEDDENNKSGIENQQKIKGITLVQHNKQVSKIKIDLQKYKRLFEQRQKQYRDLARRYSQLTNQYYKILNSYGIQEPEINQNRQLAKVRSSENIIKAKKTIATKLKSNVLSNLLQEMISSDTQIEQNCQKTKPKFNYQSNQLTQQSQTEQQKQSYEEISDKEIKKSIQENISLSKLEQILAFLRLSDPNDIITHLSKMKAKIEEFELSDTISRSLQVFFYNIGKGKITKKQLVKCLQEFQEVYQRNLQAVDQLDEICIEVGAKRQKLNEKVQQLAQTKDEYHNQLKNLKFMQQIAKGNKLIEFIEFFELDKEQLALPQQLISIQEQLKAINKFIKQAKIILQIDNEKSPQVVLELILRYIQKASSLIANFEKKPQKQKSIPS